MNAVSEAPHIEYDDRSFPRFASVRDATRTQLLLGGLVIGIVLIITGLGLSQRPLDLQSVRGLGIVILIGFFALLGILFVALLPAPLHYIIRGGVLEYPRWGGLRRGCISLSELDAFNVEGRDQTSASIVLWSSKGRVLSLPEDLLASPRDFRETLASAGLPERPPRLRR